MLTVLLPTIHSFKNTGDIEYYSIATSIINLSILQATIVCYTIAGYRCLNQILRRVYCSLGSRNIVIKLHTLQVQQ